MEKNNGKRKITVLTLIAVSIAFIITGNLFSGLDGASGSPSRGTIDISGVIEFKKINLSFKNPGKIVELNFDEGIAVKKGLLLAGLDISDLKAQKLRVENSIAYSKSLMDQTGAMIEFQKANYKSQVMSANANLSAAQSHLSEAMAGNRQQQIDQAKAALAKAQVEYERLTTDYERYVHLLKAGSTSKQNLDAVRTQQLAAEQMLNSAREQYELLKEGSRKETIDQLKAGVELAKAQLAGANALEFQVKKTENELETIKKDIEVKKADLEGIEIRIADASLYAPEDGLILEKLCETSEVVGTATPIGTLANVKDVWVRGYIPEEDLGRVKLGSEAQVISDSYPDKSYKGYVAFISSEAEFTPKNVQTKRERVKLVYRVKINVNNDSGELKLGMPVDAKIKSGE